MFITSRLFDFNGIYEKQMKHFKQFLTDGIEINPLVGNKIRLEVNVHGLITDEPGGAKVFFV